MSAAQLVFLTSLVAIVRGLFTLRVERKAKTFIGAGFDILFAVVVALLIFFYVKHRQEFAFYFQKEYIRIWIQNNLGTFVFTLAAIVLLVAFRLALLKEWSPAFLKNAYEWLDPFMMAGTIALILITYFVRTYYIPSESMVPTLEVHDYIIVAKPFVLKIFHAYPPRRNDIVVFHPPLPGENREFIKRVIGLPGETLNVHDGKVFINGQALSEAYIKSPPDYRFGPISIPKGDYLVFGDNRRNSEDSHAWPEVGATPFLSLQRIEGTAVMVFFPLNRFHFFHH